MQFIKTKFAKYTNEYTATQAVLKAGSLNPSQMVKLTVKLRKQTQNSRVMRMSEKLDFLMFPFFPKYAKIINPVSCKPIMEIR